MRVYEIVNRLTESTREIFSFLAKVIFLNLVKVIISFFFYVHHDSTLEGLTA